MDRSSSAKTRTATRNDNESSAILNSEVPDSTTTVGSADDKRFSVSVSGASATDSVSGEEGSVGSSTGVSGGSVKVPKKFITTWRHACDKTKDRTKDLFKRWRTLPETGTDSITPDEDGNENDNRGNERRPISSGSNTDTNHGWSVHVWGQ